MVGPLEKQHVAGMILMSDLEVSYELAAVGVCAQWYVLNGMCLVNDLYI